MKNNTEFPTYLNSYSNLRDHFTSHFAGLNSHERGQRFVKVVKEITPFTMLGSRGFLEPEYRQESHDEGIDLIAKRQNNSDLLCIQSKYTIADKSVFDSVISKFQGFTKKHFDESSGPLFAYKGVTLNNSPKLYFQVVTAHSLTRILESYESSHYTSLEFYNQLIEEKRLEIVDGHKMLETLKTAYRKANILSSNFDVNFETAHIKKGSVYIGILSSNELKRLYGSYGDALFYENIRNFLDVRDKNHRSSGLSINEEIIKTVEDEPDQFLSRNNGIVLKAKRIEEAGETKLKLTEASIVNGCQTTMSIVGYADDGKECFVSVKVVEIEKAWDVARAANLQNDVGRLELEIAQFLRPQTVNKAASHEGYRIIGKDSAFKLLDDIYKNEILYGDLRSLFVGIFSRTPNNIFDTNYLDLLPNLISLFYEDDPEGEELLSKLFQIQNASNTSMERIQHRMQEKGIIIEAYQRFFKENKSAYRAFFTLLAASSVSKIDLSEKISTQEERFDLVTQFLDKVIVVIENDRDKFELYYRFAMQACSSIIPPQKDKDQIKQLLWQTIRRANFSALLERIEIEALNHDL